MVGMCVCYYFISHECDSVNNPVVVTKHHHGDGQWLLTVISHHGDGSYFLQQYVKSLCPRRKEVQSVSSMSPCVSCLSCPKILQVLQVGQ